MVVVALIAFPLLEKLAAETKKNGFMFQSMLLLAVTETFTVSVLFSYAPLSVYKTTLYSPEKTKF